MSIQSVGFSFVTGIGSGMILPMPSGISNGDLVVMHMASQGSIGLGSIFEDGRFVLMHSTHQGYPDGNTWQWRVDTDNLSGLLLPASSRETVAVAVGYRGISGDLGPRVSSNGDLAMPSAEGSSGIGATLVRSGSTTTPEGWVHDGSSPSSYLLSFHTYHRDGSLENPAPFTSSGSSLRASVFPVVSSGGWRVGAVSCS